MTQRRLLVITPRFPYPLYGGDVVRIYRMCEALQRKWSITLASICQTRQEMVQEFPAGNPFSDVHRYYLPRICSYLQALGAIFSATPLQLAYYSSSGFARLIRQLLPGHDAVLCHLIRTAPYASEHQGPRFLELSDHLPLTYDRSNALGGGWLSLRRLIYRIERRRIDKAQNQLARSFDLITFVSDVDRKLFLESSGLPTSRVITLPVGVDLRERPFQADRNIGKLVFLGNMRAMPNADAIRYFVEAIFPRIQACQPEVRLKVVGQLSPRLARQLGGHNAVELTGPVPSLAAATSDCAIGLCPLRIGAGMQTKMLDYMSLGLSTVTTSIGAEGTTGTAGLHFLVADTEEDYASAVLSLLTDTQLRRRLAHAARQLVEDTYSWNAQLGELGQRFADIAGDNS